MEQNENDTLGYHKLRRLNLYQILASAILTTNFAMILIMSHKAFIYRAIEDEGKTDGAG